MPAGATAETRQRCKTTLIVWILGIMSLCSCDDDETVKDQIVVTINKTEQVTLKVHRPNAIDSFGDCSFAAYRTETNKITDYRACAFNILDCGLETASLPYTANEYFLYYSRGFTANTNDFYNTDHESESTLTITYRDSRKVKGTFSGRLYAMNTMIPEYIDVSGTFEIPIGN